MCSPAIKVMGVPVGDPASREAQDILSRPVARHRRLATLVRRMADFGGTWGAEAAAAGDEMWSVGCGW